MDANLDNKTSEIHSQAATLPLYEQVQNDLCHRISEGKFGPEGRLPSERDLCEYYSVSKVTVRRAISELVHTGMLHTVQGKGTFVANGGQRKPRSPHPDAIRFVTSEQIVERGIMRQVLGAFAEQNPGYRVEPVVLALNRLIQEFLNGGRADLLAVDAQELPMLISKGVLLDLTEFAARDLDLEAYYPRPFQFGCMASRAYAFPVTFSPVVMVYNREHFREAGLDYPQAWDWTTFLDYARRLTVTGKDGRVTRYGFYLSGNTARWPVFLLQNNGGIFDIQGNFILDSGPSLEALHFCRDLMVEQRVAPVGAPFEMNRPFVNGLASLVMQSFYLKDFANTDFEWDIGRLPHGRTRASLYLNVNLGIHRESKHPDLAWELLKFFISPPAQRLFLAQRQQWPVLRSVVEAEDAPPWVPEQSALFWEEMAVAQPIYWGEDAIRMQRVVSEGLQMVWLGLETPEAACAEIRRWVGLAENPIRF